MFPYGVLPMEVMVGCITNTQKCIPVLIEKSKMWKEARVWVEEAKVELQTRANNLAPDWTDEAGRAFEEKTKQSLADLTTWGARIDDSKVSETLASLAAELPGAEAVVLSLHGEYLLALSNPFTALGAIAFQQQAGMCLTALGTRFDTAMLTMCAAAGIANPADLLPGFPQVTGSAADAVKTADAAVNLLTEVQSLTESFGGGAGGSTGSSGLLDGWTGSDLPSSGNPGTSSLGSGLSLAGLAPNTPVPGTLAGAPLSGLSGGGLPSAGMASMPFGTLGAAGGLGGTPLAPRAGGTGKRVAGLAADIQPGGTTGSAKAAGGGMMPPSAMPQHGAAGAGGTVRPGAAEHAQSGDDQRPALGTDGVSAALRGRAIGGEGNGFTIPGHRRVAESDTGSLQLLDDDTGQ